MYNHPHQYYHDKHERQFIDRLGQCSCNGRASLNIIRDRVYLLQSYIETLKNRSIMEGDQLMLDKDMILYYAEEALEKEKKEISICDY